MADSTIVGKIGWLDITVDDAPALRDFYAAVVGWKPEDVGMDECSDYSMAMPGTGEHVAGVCHGRGNNLVRDPRGLAGGRFAIIEDPVGAITALYQEP